ncbi:tetratricopeptide repeat protein [Deltaproteobacteria bacterium TL4]
MEVIEFSKLIHFLKHPSRQVKMWAAFQLGEYWQERIEDFAGILLDSEIMEIKESAIYLIGRYRLQQYAFPIFRIFNQANTPLKQACATTLAEIQYENIEQPLWDWFQTLSEHKELKNSDLQCAARSLLLYDSKACWWKIEKILPQHYESHLKSLTIFGALCDATHQGDQIKALTRHYIYYRKNFTDPQFFQHLASVLENPEIIEHVCNRMGFGYSIRLLYQECLNLLGWNVTPEAISLLNEIDTCRGGNETEKIPAKLLALIHSLSADSNDSQERTFLECFNDIIESGWDETILKIQEQETYFLLALPLTYFIKQSEKECLESALEHFLRIARIYHSSLLRFDFMNKIINLLHTLSQKGPIPSIPVTSTINDFPKDALWKLATQRLETTDYPFPSALPKPWKYEIPFVLPKLAEIYKKDFDHLVISAQHEHIDYALELFTKKSDPAVIEMMLKHFPLLINQHFHLFVDFIEQIPDERFIERLKQHYREGEAEIAQLIGLICTLHEIENTLQPQFFQDHPHELGPFVRILCPECQASYRYVISVLYFDKELMEQRRFFTNNDLWTSNVLNCKNCNAILPLQVDKSFLSNLYAEVLTAQLLQLNEEEKKLMEPFKPLVFPRYFGKKTNPAIFLKKVEADLRGDRLSILERSELLLESGKLYLALERLEDAQEAFRQSIKLVGNQPHSLFHLGVIAYRQKNIYDARLFFSRLISISAPEDFALEEENLYQLAQHYLEILNRRDFKRSSFKLVQS